MKINIIIRVYSIAVNLCQGFPYRVVFFQRAFPYIAKIYGRVVSTLRTMIDSLSVIEMCLNIFPSREMLLWKIALISLVDWEGFASRSTTDSVDSSSYYVAIQKEKLLILRLPWWRIAKCGSVCLN